MRISLKRYPEYRDCGLPWLGEIPAHWDVRRNGRLFAQRNETGFSNLPILEVSIRAGVRIRDLENAQRKQMMSHREKYKRAARGDIAYNMMRLWQGAVGVAPVDGLISPAYVVACPYPGVESRYYAYLFRIGTYMNEVNQYSRGIVTDRNRLYWDEFKQIPSVFPPPGEQRRIANLLDEHGRYVRQFIRNKRRLVELLNEQKQAIVDRAVTRGLDPNVRLKPSDIEWLGDVPERWEVRRLKTMSRIIMGQSPDSAECNIDGHGRPFLQGCAEFGPLHPSAVQFCPTASKIAPTDAVLLSVRAPVGTLNVADQEYGIGRGLCAIVPFDNALDRDFALYAISACKIQLLMIATGSTYDAVTAGQVAAMRLPTPPVAVQRRLVRWIVTTTLDLDRAVRRAQREIDLIREYRTRLIADVVTGQLDVRHIAPDAVEPSLDGLVPADELEDLLDGRQDRDGFEPAQEADDADD